MPDYIIYNVTKASNLTLLSNIVLASIVFVSSTLSGLKYFDCNSQNTIHLYECCKEKAKTCCSVKNDTQGAQFSQKCCTEDDFIYIQAVNSCEKQSFSLKVYEISFHSYSNIPDKEISLISSPTFYRIQSGSIANSPVYKINCTYLC